MKSKSSILVEMIGDLDRIDYAENERYLQAIYERLHDLEHERRVVSSAEELCRQNSFDRQPELA